MKDIISRIMRKTKKILGVDIEALAVDIVRKYIIFAFLVSPLALLKIYEIIKPFMELVK